MTTAKDVERALFALAPRYYAEEWDNVGLLCGREEKEVCKVLVALDPFLPVCCEAAEIRADMIVTHHPLIFHAPLSVTDGDGVGKCLLFLARHDIAAANAHTNLDNAPGGVNDRLAQMLELQHVTVLAPRGTDEQGREWGLLRAGETTVQSLSDFAAFVKDRLHCPGLRYVDGGKAVHKVAVGGGSCGEEAETALRAGCDTLVTADVKYNQFQNAVDCGLNLIDAGHFETENPVCDVLASYLRKELPAVDVVLSKAHRDRIQFL